MKCKNCKEEFKPARFNQKFCFDSLCLQVCIAQEKAKQWKKTKAKMKSELLGVQDLVKIAQGIFNKWINLRDKGLPCISCQKPINGRVNASHYFNANNHWNVRFDPDNVHSSCVPCNQHLSGNLQKYRIQLIKKIGIHRLEELEAKAYITRNFTVDELKKLINLYKRKVKELEIKE